MSRKLKWILLFEAGVLVMYTTLELTFTNAFSAISAFPFEQIGLGLHALSNAGMVGNIIAIVVYCGFCLAPTAYFAMQLHKKRSYIGDWLLVVLSVLLFAVMYLMVNPAYIARRFGFLGETSFVVKAFCGVVVYSVVAGYLVLRAVHFIANHETGSMYKYLKGFLAAVAICLVFDIFSTGLTSLIASFDSLTAGNVSWHSHRLIDHLIDDPWFGQDLALSYIFLVLQWLVSVLPDVLGIIIVFSGLELIFVLEEDQYSEDVTKTARKMGQVCRRVVIVIMLSQICINLLQLGLGSLVLSSNYTLNVPLLSVVFVLAAMLSARHFETTRQLKIDNEMII